MDGSWILRLTLVIASALLALLTGLGCWTLYPGEKAFSWVESSGLDYVVGIDPTVDDSATQAAVTFGRYQEALSALSRQVPGNYFAYALTSRTGRRLGVETGSSFPLFQEFYVSDTFFEARGVTARYGTLGRETDQPTAVIGYQLARKIFGDPRLAVGQRVKLYTPGTSVDTEFKTIAGVLSPSFAQDPELDADNALVAPLATRLEEEAGTPLHLFVRFVSSAEAALRTPQLSAWARRYFGSASVAQSVNSLLGQRDAFAATALPKLAARRATLVIFVGLLVIATVLTLYLQIYGTYLHYRRSLGVKLALGASRKEVVLAFAVSQLGYSLLGGALGGLGLWFLYPYASESPASVVGVAVLSPSLLLLLLLAATTAPLFRQPIMALIQGRAQHARVRALLYLTYGGLSLALSGSVAATQVYLQTRAEAGGLSNRFASLYTLQTGAAMLDLRSERAFESPQSGLSVFEESDVQALSSLPGVTSASLAQVIPHLSVRYGSQELLLTGSVADRAYFKLLGLRLSRGDPSGCVLSQRAARELDLSPGQRLELVAQNTTCLVSGILESPPELLAWLVADLPEVVIPPPNGAGLKTVGDATPTFRSSRILLELASPEALAAVREWLQKTHPQLPAELLPYVPDARDLLSSLRVQARLFLLTAILAASLSLWGIFNGGLLLLRAERARIILDRALGMPAFYLLRVWGFKVLGLGALSTISGWLVGYVFTVRLYNALALGVPGLPERETVMFSPTLVLVTVVALLTFSTGLILVVAHKMRRQPALTLQEDGVASL